jgi:5-methylcytosine-specific restriction endonuclease McrA
MCNYCLKDIILREDRHLDHIFPLSKWWLHTINNLQWLCVKCNLSKFKCTYVTR